jgi:uncharacterized protein
MDRESYKTDEERFPELSILLDTYDISDSLTSRYLETVSSVACRRGCSNCCKNPTVPFTEPELMGINWYVTEKLAHPLKDRVKERLHHHASTHECPFLVDNECSIYEVRPLICRQFYVKHAPCGVDEQLLSTRPDDIIAPIESIATASLLRLLDYWPYRSNADKEQAFEEGVLQELTVYMHEYDWTVIAATMDTVLEKQIHSHLECVPGD